MSFEAQGGTAGGLPESPGGFQFGLQGWMWPEPMPRGITFFLDNTAKVTDQFGRAIKGAVIEGREVRFALTAPEADKDGVIKPRPEYATHQQVLQALEDERIEWRKLVLAGWPQLSYEQLKALPVLPPTPMEELRKIRDRDLRKAAMKIRQEKDDEEDKERRLDGDE